MTLWKWGEKFSPIPCASRGRSQLAIGKHNVNYYSIRRQIMVITQIIPIAIGRITVQTIFAESLRALCATFVFLVIKKCSLLQVSDKRRLCLLKKATTCTKNHEDTTKSSQIGCEKSLALFTLCPPWFAVPACRQVLCDLRSRACPQSRIPV
jgi:hypothetical protein